MSNYKVGDRVKMVSNAWSKVFPPGTEGVVTEVRDANADYPLMVAWDKGSAFGHSMAQFEDEVEHVPEDVDRTPYPKYGDWRSRVYIARNAGVVSWWYGNHREHEHGVYIKVEGGSISTAEAREIAKYLNDLADRIEHDQAMVAAGNDAKREAERKKIRQQIAELEKKLED